PDRLIHGGALFAMGLIDELNHALVASYRAEIDPAVFSQAIRWFAAQAKPEELEKLLLQFTEQFPNTAIFRGEVTPRQWLNASTDGRPNREAADLKQKTIYQNVAAAFPDYFNTRPQLAPEVGSLLDALRAPMLASPDSLTGQLEFIRTRWAKHLGPDLRRALLAIDILREEDLAIWLRFHPPGPDWHRHAAPGWGTAGFVGDEFIGFEQEFSKRRYARDYQAPLNEYEAFSSDQAWMPNA